MRVGTRAGLVLMASALVAGAPVVTASASTSVAAPSVAGYDACPRGRMCIWHDRNGGGARLSFAHKARDLSELEGGLNDHVLSAWNRTGRRWCLYEHAHYKGDKRAAAREPLVGSKGNTTEFGYKISSLKPC
ncbi:peptidase inhibitor family I36 protein [Actinomadura montaniterrae]|uniref:Peptidase inhibitor family I36 protein n=1 Tax=Actinomadura montaniterrae TaxID=1803903 RepID=A0A6L3VYQ1_9ACTN|nr:peptidase inhibitor family I36 protein [Actinomadura montaniterrae]KAB2378107.1 hypothetical protein F9B16_23670 [Actinomadura montaniterrae]